MTSKEYQDTYANQQPKKRVYKESTEQGTIAGYIKLRHKDIVFITTRIEGFKQPWEQNLIKKLNSDSGFPDTVIFAPNQIILFENKKLGTKLTLADGETIASDHLDNQYRCHLKLWALGFPVYFTVGVTDAITKLEQILSGTIPPMQVFKRRASKVDAAADNFFKNYFEG